jgi:acetylcholinesterase
MVADGAKTEKLLRGGFMQSGAQIPVGDITGGQPFYDALVQNTGCSGSSDTLECMRQVSEDVMQAAADKSLPFTSNKASSVKSFNHS